MTQERDSQVDVKDGASNGDSAKDDGQASEESSKSERKERVLHTRVPAVLEQELKRLAHSLRMPVSNVVRAILEDAVTAVDAVGRRAEGEMSRVVDQLAHRRERLRDIATGSRSSEEKSDDERAVDDAGGGLEREESVTDQLEGVIGFQPLVLAARASCSVCGVSLKAGTQAYVGVRDEPGPRVLIGPECLPKPEEH